MLARKAYIELYDKEPGRDLSVKYSGRFKGYNANVRYTNDSMVFSLSKEWKGVSQDIRIGLLQTLMQKALGVGTSTMNIDLYNIFLKKVHIAAPRQESHPMLIDSFERVNQRYFDGMMEMPNLVFGTDSKRKLGSYEYGSDTITISKILAGQGELLDYVMYHELLHKKFKYNVKNGRSFHHTREFREAEHLFENHELMEKRLSRLAVRKKITSFLGF